MPPSEYPPPRPRPRPTASRTSFPSAWLACATSLRRVSARTHLCTYISLCGPMPARVYIIQAPMVGTRCLLPGHRFAPSPWPPPCVCACAYAYTPTLPLFPPLPLLSTLGRRRVFVETQRNIRKPYNQHPRSLPANGHRSLAGGRASICRPQLARGPDPMCPSGSFAHPEDPDAPRVRRSRPTRGPARPARPAHTQAPEQPARQERF